MAVRQSPIPKLVSILVLLFVTLLSPIQAESESGVEVEGPNGIRCVPFKALFSPRLVRSPIDGGKKLRMLRGDAGFRKIEHLMRAHHNCLLKTDRIRFKKSGPSVAVDSARFRTAPMEAVLVETRPIHILKQHLSKASSQQSHGQQQSQQQLNPVLQSQPFQLEPIEVEMINDSDRAEMLPTNEWMEAFDVNASEDTK